jgi:hypothetical protein
VSFSQDVINNFPQASARIPTVAMNDLVFEKSVADA